MFPTNTVYQRSVNSFRAHITGAGERRWGGDPGAEREQHGARRMDVGQQGHRIEGAWLLDEPRMETSRAGLNLFTLNRPQSGGQPSEGVLRVTQQQVQRPNIVRYQASLSIPVPQLTWPRSAWQDPGSVISGDPGNKDFHEGHLWGTSAPRHHNPFASPDSGHLTSKTLREYPARERQTPATGGCHRGSIGLWALPPAPSLASLLPSPDRSFVTVSWVLFSCGGHN